MAARSMLRLAMFIVLATALLPCIRVRAADDVEELRRRREQDRSALEQQLRNIRELPGTYSMQQVCQIRPEGAGWVLTSKLPTVAAGQSVRLKVEGLSDYTQVTVHSDPSGGTRAFSLSNTSFSDPRSIRVATHVSWSPASLSISRFSQSLRGYTNISFVQSGGTQSGIRVVDPPSRSSVPREVQFSMQSYDGISSRVTFQRKTPDFASLRRSCPEQLDEHFRPLLRSLHLEAMLAVEPLLAFQVFAEDLKCDPRLQEKIAAILPALDADSFRERHEGLRKLREMGSEGALAILRVDRSRLSPQQNMLLDTALAPFQSASAGDIARLRSDTSFLVDCLYTDSEPIGSVALQRLREATSRNIEFDTGASYDKRVAAIEKLRLELAGTPSPATRPASASR